MRDCTLFRFLHASDLHLDSPLCGLERYEGAPADRIRGATRRALEKLVRLAIDEEVKFVLLAGDLYDGDWKDYNTALFLSAQMSKLRRHGIRVFAVSGNHDAESQITKSLSMPDNVTFFSTRAPQSHFLEELGVAIHGQGFPKRAVPEDLSESYPPPRKGALNIGLLHTSATGREGHATYAPCTLDGLRAKRYDYWALGHVHAREVLSTEPWIVFPGNIQGRHARETGPKGCSLVTVTEGKISEVEHRDLHVLRWERCAVDASGAETPDDVLLRVRTVVEEAYRHESNPLAVRVTITGPCKAHTGLQREPERWGNEIRASLTDACGGDVWVEKIAFRSRAHQDFASLVGQEGPVGDLLRAIQTMKTDPALLPSIKGALNSLRAKFPPELFPETDPFDLENPEVVARLLEGAEQLLIPWLLEEGGAG